MQYCIQYSRIILNIKPISLKSSKNPFPAHFRCTKFSKFHFRFSFTASKDAEFNSRGSPKGGFQDPRMFMPRKSTFDLFGKKLPARLVTVKVLKSDC